MVEAFHLSKWLFLADVGQVILLPRTFLFEVYAKVYVIMPLL